MIERITGWIRDLGIDLEYTQDLPKERLGAYLDDECRILIRAGLPLPLELETLAHEFVHAFHRDRTSHPTVEWRAWGGAAQILIAPEAYAAAEQVSTSSLYIAQELGVTTRIVEIYRQALVRGEIILAA